MQSLLSDNTEKIITEALSLWQSDLPFAQAVLQAVQTLLASAYANVARRQAWPSMEASFDVNPAKKPEADWASNLPFVLGKALKIAPLTVAEMLVAEIHALARPAWLQQVEAAAPGFINFYISPLAYAAGIGIIRAGGQQFGRSQLGKGQLVQVEYVSANPTGPLHVGHGRGAAVGSVLANILKAAGFAVFQEYYVNDAGRQMDILATSVWWRYLALFADTPPFPSKGYRGDYIAQFAEHLRQQYGEALLRVVDAADLPADGSEVDGENYVDAAIALAKAKLGADYKIVFDYALNEILADIRQDLQEFGVHYDAYFSEASLSDNGLIHKCLEALAAAGHLYEQDGALWFAASRFGDEKDRVVQRENGQYTYFASDIAYHWQKFQPQANRPAFDQVIDIWGADHHGYVPRLHAALQALGIDPKRLEVLLVQFVTLYRHGQKVQMSTRSGSFITLRELRGEVGNDAARIFYLQRKIEQHLDFDLDLAIAQSQDNPLYYLQYAHARLASILRQAQEKGFSLPPLACTILPTEAEAMLPLLRWLAEYPTWLQRAALERGPQLLIQYLRELAQRFHGFYHKYQFLTEDDAQRQSRLALLLAVQQVLHNGLQLLNIQPLEEM
jgi:arginyl-tRNA synthetase